MTTVKYSNTVSNFRGELGREQLLEQTFVVNSHANSVVHTVVNTVLELKLETEPELDLDLALDANSTVDRRGGVGREQTQSLKLGSDLYLKLEQR